MVRSSWIKHGDAVNVEISILNGLVYQVFGGRYISRLHQIEFPEMGNVAIPCYAQYVSFDFKFNNDIMARSEPLTLYDLTASFQRTLVVALWDNLKHSNEYGVHRVHTFIIFNMFSLRIIHSSESMSV